MKSPDSFGVKPVELLSGTADFWSLFRLQLVRRVWPGTAGPARLGRHVWAGYVWPDTSGPAAGLAKGQLAPARMKFVTVGEIRVLIGGVSILGKLGVRYE